MTFPLPRPSIAKLSSSALAMAAWLAAIAAADDPSMGHGAAWKAPPEAAKAANPVGADEHAIAAGKKVYSARCFSCHGATGHGDGPEAKDLDPRPADFADPRIAGETDGELFWKVTQGNRPMPSFKSRLAANERWQVVGYIRTLAARGAATPGRAHTNGTSGDR